MRSLLVSLAIGIGAGVACAQCDPEQISWIAGEAEEVAIVGDVAIVAENAGGIHTLDISDPTNPTPIAKMELGQNARAMVYRDGLAFVGGNQQSEYSALRVVDVSDPASLPVIGELVFKSESTTNAMEIVGDVIYAVTQYELHFIDISDVTRPTLMAAQPVQPNARYVEIVGDLAYIGSSEGVFVYDISDPQAIVRIGEYHGLSSPWPIVVVGDLAYAASTDDEFAVLDVTDPTNPMELSKLTIFGNNHDIELRGNEVIVTGNSIWRIDVADPTAPKIVDHAPLPRLGDDIKLDEPLAYVAAGYAGLVAIDLTNLSLVGDYSPPAGADNLDFYADLAFVHAQFGAYVVDYADPANPVPVSWFKFPPYNYNSEHVAIDGYIGYFDTHENVIVIADISDPENVQKLEYYNSEAGYIRDVDVKDGVLYVTGSDFIVAADLSDAGSPLKLAQYPLESGASDLEFDGDLGYITQTYEGLLILDFSNPASPQVVGDLSLAGTGGDPVAIDVALGEGVAYVAAGVAGFVTVDIRDPSHPVVLDAIDVEPGTSFVAVADDLAYVTTLFGVRIYDVTYPSHIKEIGSIPTNKVMHRVKIRDGLLYLANSAAGVRVYEPACQPCPADVNGDASIDILDFVTFQLIWTAQIPGADCNHDGVFDELDFACYADRFIAGCN